MSPASTTPPEQSSSSQMAAISIDSAAALTLCSILLEVLAQAPDSRDLLRAALERAEGQPVDGDPARRAAEMIALGRLREVIELAPLKAA